MNIREWDLKKSSLELRSHKLKQENSLEYTFAPISMFLMTRSLQQHIQITPFIIVLLREFKQIETMIYILMDAQLRQMTEENFSNEARTFSNNFSFSTPNDDSIILHEILLQNSDSFLCFQFYFLCFLLRLCLNIIFSIFFIEVFANRFKICAKFTSISKSN